MPEITVLMSVYNGVKTLREAVESVQAQSFADWELVAVDDCSTDGSRGLLEELAAGDARIRVAANAENLGLPRSLNRGLREARGAFISRLDADDRFLPHLLARQVPLLRARPRLAVLAAAYCFIDEDGNHQEIRRPPGGAAGMRLRLLFSSPIAHVGCMIRRAALEEAGGYSEDPAHRYAEDWELWTRLSQTWEIDVLDEILFEVRRGRTLTVVYNDRARACAKNVMHAAAARFMGGAEYDREALERLWLAYMFREWNAVRSGDVKALAPLWERLARQPGAQALTRRLLAVAGHLALQLPVGEAIMLGRAALNCWRGKA